MKTFARLKQRSLMAFLLSTAMLFGLFGCSKEDETNIQTEETEYVYVADFLDLGDSGDVCAVKEINGKLHIITSMVSGEITAYNLVVFDLEDKSIHTVALESVAGGYFTPIINNDGSIDVLEIKDEYNGGENIISQEMFFNQYAADGMLVSSEDAFDKLGLEEGFYISTFIKDSEGNYLIGNWQSPLMIYSPELVKVDEIPNTNGQLGSLCVTESGKVVSSWWGNTGINIAVLDVAGKSLGSTIETGKSGGSATVWPGEGDSVLFMDGTSLCSCDINTGAVVSVMDTMDMDVNGEFVQAAYSMSGGKYLMIYYNYSANVKELLIANPVDASTIAERKELTLATIYSNWDINNAVVEFNRTNTEYRIEVIDYSEGSYDFEASLANLQNDIVAGNVPDIIDMSAGDIPWRNWVSKEIITDLYPLMEADGTFVKEDLLDNVRRAYEVGDSFYVLPAGFSIECTLAKADTVEGITALTPELLLEMEASLPSDVELFWWNDQSTVMYNLVYENLDAYIDYETGECYFNTNDFKTVLEYAKEQPQSFEYEERGSAPVSLQADKVIFDNLYLHQIGDYQFHKAILGGNITCLGYATPTDEDGIQIVSNNTALAITEDSEYKDGAWQFLKMFVCEEYQTGELFSGIPSTKVGFENFIYEAQHIEESGLYRWDDVEMEIAGATDADIEEVRALVEKADTVAYTNQALVNIIEEEVSAYFADQKTADEVADIIQSRVSVYLKENM